jgi:hypothetical protein
MSKYTPEIIVEICEYLESGLNQKDACILANISHQTFHRWQEEHSEFCEAIQSAKIKNKKFHIDKITQAKTWQASAWYLERVYHQEFSVKKEEVKQPITIQWEEIKMKKAE